MFGFSFRSSPTEYGYCSTVSFVAFTNSIVCFLFCYVYGVTSTPAVTVPLTVKLPPEPELVPNDEGSNFM